jgi:hypothetical protein
MVYGFDVFGFLARDDVFASCAGVFLMFFILMARGSGIPWIGGKLGTKTTIISFRGIFGLVGGLLIAYPIYSTAAFLIATHLYSASSFKQFLLASAASVQFVAGRGLLA